MADFDIVDLGEQRHTSTEHMLRTLKPNPNLKGTARQIAEDVNELAQDVVDKLADGPELTAGLRKLREAKDCFIVALLAS
jgi:hypothetical protein